jgi:hypothetical protein
MAYVDCVSTFPESNVQTNDKFDLGPMTLNLNSTDGRTAQINLQAFNNGVPYVGSKNVLIEYWMCDKKMIDLSKAESFVDAQRNMLMIKGVCG